MEEFPSTGEINTAVDEQPSHFGATTGTGTSIPYYDGAHAIVLFSISHVGMPPIALDPREPAVRFYGCFENRAMASAFAKRVAACDPTCNIQMGDTHKWILACSTAERCNDAAYADAKISRLVAHHAQATESTKDAFIARSAELRKAGPEPAAKPELNQVSSTDTQINTAKEVLQDTPSDIPQPQAQPHLDSSTRATKATDLSTTVHTDEQTSVATDTAEIKTPTATGSFLDSSCTLAFQSVLCVAFVKDELDPSEPEFMFKVFRSCKDETEAGGYIKAVASKHITDHSIDVVDMCSWGFPQSETAIQTTYRNKQLDDIMRNDPVLPTW
jgi:hypothetical protein